MKSRNTYKYMNAHWYEYTNAWIMEMYNNIKSFEFADMTFIFNILGQVIVKGCKPPPPV